MYTTFTVFNPNLIMLYSLYGNSHPIRESLKYIYEIFSYNGRIYIYVCVHLSRYAPNICYKSTNLTILLTLNHLIVVFIEYI